MTAVPDPEARPLLTVPEVAEILGWGGTAVRDAIDRGELPVVRLGRRLYVPTGPLRRDVLRVDPPGSSTAELVEALRHLIALEGPAGTAGPPELITHSTAKHHEDRHAA